MTKLMMIQNFLNTHPNFNIYAIHCETQDEAAEFITIMYQLGYKFDRKDIDVPRDKDGSVLTKWKINKSNTCYALGAIGDDKIIFRARVRFYENQGREIFDYRDIVDGADNEYSVNDTLQTPVESNTPETIKSQNSQINQIPFQNATPVLTPNMTQPMPNMSGFGFNPVDEESGISSKMPQDIQQNPQTQEIQQNENNTYNSPKFCSNCGFRLKEGAKFCPECGTKVEVENTEDSNISNIENKREQKNSEDKSHLGDMNANKQNIENVKLNTSSPEQEVKINQYSPKQKEITSPLTQNILPNVYGTNNMVNNDPHIRIEPNNKNLETDETKEKTQQNENTNRESEPTICKFLKVRPYQIFEIKTNQHSGISGQFRFNKKGIREVMRFPNVWFVNNNEQELAYLIAHPDLIVIKD